MKCWVLLSVDVVVFWWYIKCLKMLSLKVEYYLDGILSGLKL